MKRTHSLIVLGSLSTLIGAGAAEVQVPKKAPLTRYTQLWTSSPFTTPPRVDGNTPEVNPFEDLALRGIAPLSTGRYLITLVNKKNPTETTTIDTERSSEYEVLGIERDSEKPLGTVVRLKTGTKEGTVTYDEKLSTLKAPPKPGQHQGQPGQPQQGAPGQPPMPPGVQPNNTPAAAPPQFKPRVMAPATTTPTPTPSTNRFQPGGGGRGSMTGGTQSSGRSSQGSGRSSRRPGG